MATIEELERQSESLLRLSRGAIGAAIRLHSQSIAVTDYGLEVAVPHEYKLEIVNDGARLWKLGDEAYDLYKKLDAAWYRTWVELRAARQAS